MATYKELQSDDKSISNNGGTAIGKFYSVELIAENGKKEKQRYFVLDTENKADVLQAAANHWDESQPEVIMI